MKPTRRGLFGLLAAVPVAFLGKRSVGVSASFDAGELLVAELNTPPVTMGADEIAKRLPGLKNWHASWVFVDEPEVGVEAKI